MSDGGRPESSTERALRLARQALREDTTTTVDPDREVARQALHSDPPAEPARLTRAFSYVLDDLVRVPGTNWRFGVDPVLSLIPAAGSAVGAAFGAVVLVDAVRLRAPVPVLARMLGNYVIDWLVGLVPFLGAFFDMAYRSNRKNLRLLNRTIAEREQVRKASLTYWITVAAMLLVILLVVVGVPVAALLWADHLITGG